MPNEAALAGVVGHEIAHAEERHSTERMTTSYGLSTLLSIVLGESPGQIEAMAANLVGGLYLLQHSRSDELESDVLSFRYLQDTEYYPAAMEYFFQELGDGDAEFSIEQLLITHPDPDIRLEEIREMARANNVEATSENLFTGRYQDFLRTLR
jgi:predicted Zn-dependent protease